MKSALKMQDEMLSSLQKQNKLIKKCLAEEEDRSQQKDLKIDHLAELVHQLRIALQHEQENLQRPFDRKRDASKDSTGGYGYIKLEDFDASSSKPLRSSRSRERGLKTSMFRMDQRSNMHSRQQDQLQQPMRSFVVASKDSYSPFKHDQGFAQSERELNRLDRLISEYKHENDTCSRQILDLQTKLKCQSELELRHEAYLASAQRPSSFSSMNRAYNMHASSARDFQSSPEGYKRYLNAEDLNRVPKKSINQRTCREEMMRISAQQTPDRMP